VPKSRCRAYQEMIEPGTVLSNTIMYEAGSISTWIPVRYIGNVFIKNRERSWLRTQITQLRAALQYSTQKDQTCALLAKGCSFYTIKPAHIGSVRLCTCNIQNDVIIWVKLEHHYHQDK
jgi:hypothetical protein